MKHSRKSQIEIEIFGPGQSRLLLKWIDTYVPMTEMEYSKEYKKEVFQAKVESVFKLRESRTVVQLELALIPAPVKEKGERAYFSFVLSDLWRRAV